MSHPLTRLSPKAKRRCALPLIAAALALAAGTAGAEPRPYASLAGRQAPTPAAAAAPTSTLGLASGEVAVDEAGYGGQVNLAIGGSRILRFNRPIGRVMLGDPKIGDVIALGERTLYVLAKAPGATSLTVLPRDRAGPPLATLDLRIGYDVDNLKRALHEIMPDEPLDVTARGDGVVLTGLLSSSAVAARAAALAERYAPEHVVNLTSIRGAEQVMLSVRVAEVQRSALTQLGLNNINALWDPTHLLTLGAGTLNSDAVANLLGRTAGGNWTVQGLFDALERRGFASTLAEPNLVALSGETAVFFAGGEFPIPVPQVGAVGASSTITIEYKQYGVSSRRRSVGAASWAVTMMTTSVSLFW
jgi:pilus assembly protein CpaC